MYRKLTDKKIKECYDLIKKYHKTYLLKCGVKLPELKHAGKYTKDALALVYLAEGYPNTSIVSKTELTEFIKSFYPKTNDVQQGRHLGAQNGWFILSGTRNDNYSLKLKPGEYKLHSLKKPYPGYSPKRREYTANEDNWEKLKAAYDYRCACCGSKENEPHRYWKNTLTKLEKGHKDPRKPLKAGNIIPQCGKCNRPDRNYWIYDNKGRVIGVANATVIDKCTESLKKEIYQRLYRKYGGKSPSKI